MKKAMKSAWKIAILSAVAATAMSVTPTAASNDVFLLPLTDAMADPNPEIDKSVAFYFGATPHPAVRKSYGEYVTNMKTNAFGKSDMKACSWVFQSALLELQKRAHSLGANAVINIVSYYKKETVSSTTDIQCHTGFLIAGITLKGTFVNVR